MRKWRSLTASRKFAEWALALSIDDIPVEVRRAASRHLLDGFGCGLAAARLDEVLSASAVARAMTAPEEATVIGAAARIPAPVAALANGSLVHALDYDDTHTDALVHATAAVLPAAFAVAEERSVSGTELLVACIAGYELVTRLGSAVRHGFHSRGFHATSVCGVFASALIASRLMRSDVDTTVNALGIAGSAASGSLEFLNTGSATKQLHPGLSGMNGIMAARLAAEGASGPDSIFEGDHGLFRSFADSRVDPEAITDGLGSGWETTRITIKPYPACQLSHASLDALNSIRDEIGNFSEVESITFDVPAESVPIISEPEQVKKAPRTPYEGKFSLPFSAAALLLEVGLRPDSFDSGKLHVADTLAIAGKVRYRTTHPPVAAADAPGRVEVKKSDGSIVVGEVSASRGGPTHPLSDDEVMEKFRSNCADVYPFEDIARMIFEIQKLDGISALMSLVRRSL